MRKVASFEFVNGTVEILDGGFSMEYPGLWVHIVPAKKVDWGITYADGLFPAREFSDWYWEKETFKKEVQSLFDRI